METGWKEPGCKQACSFGGGKAASTPNLLLGEFLCLAKSGRDSIKFLLSTFHNLTNGSLSSPAAAQTSNSDTTLSPQKTPLCNVCLNLLRSYSLYIKRHYDRSGVLKAMIA